MRNNILQSLFLMLLVVFATKTRAQIDTSSHGTEVKLRILGIAQDGGSPHIGCRKACCKDLFNHPELRRNVTAIGLTDSKTKKKFIFECTPDFPVQAKMLHRITNFSETEMPDGILLTHAHIGHYAGLMFLGREALNAKNVPVYAMPRMKDFLERNGPWSQLVKLQNIDIRTLTAGEKSILSPSISVTPLKVPHRDEFSETVGFVIQGPSKKVLFIPDIDKWEKWELDISSIIGTVDYAFVDGTFFDGEEINSRNIKEIPHPFVTESMELWQNLPEREKQKVYFIHFNHTNPLLNPESEAASIVRKNGFHVATQDLELKL
jgi:pyrroloquinoline quinone biosynthesis protein B